MTDNTRARLIEHLTAISTLAPEMRFGQLMAILGFLAEDMSDRSIWEIEDAELLKVLEKHRAQLENRQPSEPESMPAKGR